MLRFKNVSQRERICQEQRTQKQATLEAKLTSCGHSLAGFRAALGQRLGTPWQGHAVKSSQGRLVVFARRTRWSFKNRLFCTVRRPQAEPCRPPTRGSGAPRGGTSHRGGSPGAVGGPAGEGPAWPAAFTSSTFLPAGGFSPFSCVQTSS